MLCPNLGLSAHYQGAMLPYGGHDLTSPAAESWRFVYYWLSLARNWSVAHVLLTLK
jgi:hypothetical protein